MFEELLKAVKKLDGASVSVPVPIDADGYVDKECPSEFCMFQFKIMGEDWCDIVRDEEVFCPFCRHTAPADAWFTTEQAKALKARAFHRVHQEFDRALRKDAATWNRQQPRNAFFKMNLSYKPAPRPVLVPVSAAESMRQKAICAACGCRYSYIGAAFFCPACGHNSAEATFQQTLNAIRTAVGINSVVRSVMERDDAEITIRLLREKGMTDTVMAFQRLAERLYARIPGAAPAPRNAFQRLDDGSALWDAAKQLPYTAFVDAAEYQRLRVYFQQRHLLAHAEGIVDQDYISRSGDTTYTIGQRLVITEAALTDFVTLMEKLGAGLIGAV